MPVNASKARILLLNASFVVFLLVLMSSCGGGGTNSTSSSSTSQIIVSIAPGFVSLVQGGTQSFTATVIGTTNTAVNWSVQEGNAGGTITSTGMYTAPNTAGTFHITAT